MQHNTISGIIRLPNQNEQLKLHQQLGSFAERMQRPKDSAKIHKDKQKAVPVAMLPVLF